MADTLVAAVDKYLVQAWTLRDLEQWLVARLRQIQQSGDERLRRLADEVDADLAEFSEGLLDEATLAVGWDGYLRHWGTITHDDRPPAMVSSVSNTGVATRCVALEIDPPTVITVKRDLVFA